MGILKRCRGELLESSEGKGGGSGKGRRGSGRGGRGRSGGRGRRFDNSRGTAISVTVAKRFKDQLAALIRTMKATTPRFVRCIKSNTEKEPLTFEAPSVLRQLKYAGVMEALRVRRAGFPNRILYRNFLLEFRLLLGSNSDLVRRLRNKDLQIEINILKKATRVLMGHRSIRAAGITSDQYQIGTTKIFLRADVLHILNSVQEKLMSDAATMIQNMVRTMIAYRHHQHMAISAIKLQQQIRGFLGRREHKEMLRRHAEARRKRERERQIRLEKERAAALERKRIQQMQKIESEAVSMFTCLICLFTFFPFFPIMSAGLFLTNHIYSLYFGYTIF